MATQRWSRLAYLITGNSNDWTALNYKGPIVNPYTTEVPNGQQVDISPLLDLLEKSLRNSAVSAATSFNPNVGFANNEKPRENWGGWPLSISQLNAYFRGSNDDTLKINCQAACELVYCKAVLDVVGVSAYTDISALWGSGFGFDGGGVPTEDRPVVQDPEYPFDFIGLKPGDWGVIANVEAPTPRVIGRENVICVSTRRFPTRSGGLTGTEPRP